jgi:hypothetical protein
MTPGNYALAIYRGDTHAWQFTLWADLDKTIPVDLTGVTVKAEIRVATGAPTLATLNLTVTPPNIVLAELDPAQTRPLPTSARWDFQLTDDASGRVTTIIAGPVKVSGDITESDASRGVVPLPRTSGYLTGETV